MKNIKKESQKTCLLLNDKELNQVVKELFDGRVRMEYTIEGIEYYATQEEHEDFVEDMFYQNQQKFYEKLAEYFDVGSISSIHMVFCDWDNIEVWLVYQGNSHTSNTRIRYLYRDASNYKRQQSVILKGRITKEQIDRILDSCDGEYFIPEQVGLSCDRFEEYGRNPDDHCWCELYEEDFEETNEPPTEQRSIEQLVQAFVDAKDRWDEVTYAV